ncbi:MAG: trehalose 6-phosphate synthase [Desulfovibrionaceae bacterium]
MAHAIERHAIADLKEFYELMAQTRDVRFRAVCDIFAGRAAAPGVVTSLAHALENLRAIPQHEGKSVLEVTAGRRMGVDLSYELSELEKDILFLGSGEAALLRHLEDLHEGFADEVRAASDTLRGMNFNCWITDRDGTTNNYCGRYNSSIQSAYNAVFLSRFARARVGSSVFITSAPLRDPGIVNISVNPEGSFIYAASKGRECLDRKGAHRTYPIEAAKQALLDSFNDHMTAILEDSAYEIFTLIGSGFQKKFGQTTIARQDITKTIPEPESLAFLDKIEAVTSHVDPQGGNFRIEDTGLDVEVILTVEGGDGLKDFSKAEGVNFLNETFDLKLSQGPNLVSGDTRSDLPLAEAVLTHCPDTWAVFVTRDQSLASAVRSLASQSLIVSSPDVLVAALGNLA